MSALGLAISTGILGSLHCAAMCGPLAVAGCRSRREGAGYLFGRIIAYGTMGALLGLLGRHSLSAIPVQWIERAVALTLAAWLAWRGLTLLRPARPSLVALRTSPPRSASTDWLLSLAPTRGLGLGLLTGFLPCGLLFGAWLIAAASGGAASGAGLMLAFALSSSGGLLVPLLFRRVLEGTTLRVPVRAQAAAWLLLALFVAARPLLLAPHCAH